MSMTNRKGRRISMDETITPVTYDRQKTGCRRWSTWKLMIFQLSAQVVKVIALPLVYPLRWLEKEILFTRLDLSYIRRPSDIFVVAYPKSGTTWVQMILYQLTTEGTMSMRHIDEVSPHYEESNINLENLKSPRIIKTHIDYRGIP